MKSSYPPTARRAFTSALFKLLVVTLGAWCASAFGADAATGTIQGRVVNAASGLYVNRAVVAVEGTNQITYTDDFGTYTLNNVPVGTAKVKVTSTGQTPLEASVDVKAGAIASQDFMFNREKATATSGEGTIVKLNEYVVQSERFKTATEIALNEERYSPTLKNVVAAGQFGNIPDGNIGEFVKYIPGVQIDYGYDGGAGNAAENNATSISVRGFGPEFTAITVDGVPLTNASPATLTRAIGLDMMTMNNASRVEVIKVPTPDMPSNSPGGSINLVTKSAFEYAKPYLTWKVGFSANSENINDLFKKTPGPANKDTYKTLPGVDFTYVIPMRKNMGIAFTGAWSKTFNENHQAKLDRLYVHRDVSTSSSYKVDLTPGGGPTIDVKGTGQYTTFHSADGDELNFSNPLLYRYQVLDTPNTVTRKSGSLRFDWRPTPGQEFALGYTYGLTTTRDASRRLQFYAGDKSYYKDWGDGFVDTYQFLAKGTVVNGKALTADFNPRATIAQEIFSRDRWGATHTGYLKYTFRRGPWAIFASANASRSRGSYEDLKNNHFSGLDVNLTVGRLRMTDFKDDVPSRVETWDKTGNPIDYTKLVNWPAPSIRANSGETYSMDQYINMRADVSRELDFIPDRISTVVAKTGWYRTVNHQKKWGKGTGYKMTYYGPTLALENYMDEYQGMSPGFGLPGQEWISTYKLYELWEQNPTYFNADSDNDRGSNYQSWVTQQKDLTETSDQFYLQFSGKALRNRFNWVFGSRIEKLDRKGYGPFQDSSWQYVKNKDGTIYRDAANPSGVKFDSASSVLFKTDATGTALRSSLTSAGLWFPDHPISSSATGGTFMEYSQLRYLPYRSLDSKQTGKPTFTASGTYNVTEDFQATLSWNRSQAKPDLEKGTLTRAGDSRALTIAEATDPTASPRGTITMGNPDLKPWIADSYDLQLAYYTKTGGKFAVTPYYKQTKNFHDEIELFDDSPEFATVLHSIGLDPASFEDWKITTVVNGAGTAKTLGYELEARQNLGVLGRWGKHFDVWGAYSHQYIKRKNTNTSLSVKPTAKDTLSGGASFSAKRIRAMLRGVYYQRKYNGQSNYLHNNETFVLARYIPSYVQLDLNLGYQLTPRYSLFLDARNFINTSRDLEAYDPGKLIPSWAKLVDRKQFGVQWYFGINGTF